MEDENVDVTEPGYVPGDVIEGGEVEFSTAVDTVADVTFATVGGVIMQNPILMLFLGLAFVSAGLGVFKKAKKSVR